MDTVQQSFLNMTLSLRGAERQPPNVLQQALRFSAVMTQRAAQGIHAAELNAEARLRKVVAEFHESPGFLAKWTLDEDRICAILHVITGTTEPTREAMRSHLNSFKWNQSALNSELLRRPRWLLGACPKGASDVFKRVLTVSADSQVMMMELVLSQFEKRCRKVRPNQRARMRLSGQEWDQYVNYSCMICQVLDEGRKLSNTQDHWEQQVRKAFDALFLGISWLSHLV